MREDAANLKLHLATGQVETTPYLGKTRSAQESRIVLAEDEAAARAKFIEHFEGRSRRFEVDINVVSVEVHEAIR